MARAFTLYLVKLGKLAGRKVRGGERGRQVGGCNVRESREREKRRWGGVRVSDEK